MAAADMMRCFLALTPPEAILSQIGAVQETLRRAIRGEVRWVRPEAVHLTLKFFGDISADGVGLISAVLEEAAPGTAPFALSLGGVGVFPDARRPRVLWLGMGGDVQRLLAFQRALERSLGEIGFTPEERPFQPHLTLARIKSPRGLTGLSGVLEKAESYAAGSFLAEGIGLLRSELTPQGAIYTRINGFPFGGK